MVLVQLNAGADSRGRVCPPCPRSAPRYQSQCGGKFGQSLQLLAELPPHAPAAPAENQQPPRGRAKVQRIALFTVPPTAKPHAGNWEGGVSRGRGRDSRPTMNGIEPTDTSPTKHCPTCGQLVVGPAAPSPAALDHLVEQLRAWCQTKGHVVLAADRVREDTAAEILDRSVGTLRNWRAGARPLPFTTVHGRTTYFLRDLAQALAKTNT